jgi:hypothetical protein
VSGSITPPGGGAANPPPIQNFAQAIAQVTQIPAQLRNQVFAALQTMTLANALANGGQNPQTQVQGQVVGKDAGGATLIKTDAGTVGIRTQMPLPQGASVTLQIGGTQQAPQAVIVQVQPQAAPANAAPVPQAPTPPPTPPAPSAAQQPATNFAATAQAAQPSVQTTATVVGPPVPAVPATPAAAQAKAVTQAQTAPQMQTAPPAATQQTLQTGTSVQVRVVPDAPPTTAQQVAAQPAAPAPARSQFVETLTARVVAHTPGGQTVVDSSMGRLAMTWPAGVPRPAEGARMSLEVTLPLPVRNASAEPAIRSSVPLARDWPNLKDALKELATADPALARRVMDEGLPRPGPRLAVQVLSYLATDRTDARSLLGESVSGALDRAGHGDLLQRLDSDLREMQRQANASNDWRAAYVPFYDGRDLRQLRLFSRREGEGGKRERDSKRFIVELDFSELGEVQIDGLMRKPRLELMLRTHKEIPRDMRDELEVVFLDGCTLVGLAGKIYFQAIDRFPVSPLDDIARKERGVIA